jgi:hypothetical protein
MPQNLFEAGTGPQTRSEQKLCATTVVTGKTLAGLGIEHGQAIVEA